MHSQGKGIKKRLNNSFQYDLKEKFISLFKRIKENKSSQSSTLSFLQKGKKKLYIFPIKNKKNSDLNKINKFVKRFIDFEKSEDKNFKRYIDYKKINDYFSGMYKSLQKKKKKRGDHSFLYNEFYFTIANKYLLKNIRLPNMAKNIFNSNPLILSNAQIKKYFINHNNDSKKFLDYLERLKEMAFRKITGNDKLSTQEQKNLENIIKNEKPKNFVEPEILIPKLQEDIEKSQFTYDCLINKNNRKTIEESNKRKLLKLKRVSIFDIRKLDITKKKNFENDINNENKKNNDNDNNKNNINTSSIDATLIPINKRNTIIKNQRNNIFIRRKTQTQAHFLVSPFKNKLLNNTSVNIFNNELDISNPNIGKNYNPFFNNKSPKYNRNFLNGSFNNNLKIDKELNNSSSLLDNDKFNLFSPKKKIDFNKFMNNKIEEKREKLDKNIFKKLNTSKIISTKLKKNNNQTNDFIKSISNNNSNIKESPTKINIESNYDFFKKRMSCVLSRKYKTKIDLENEHYQNIENLYNKALHFKSKSFQVQGELEKYLMSSKKKQNLNELMNLKNTYFYIHKMERNFEKKNVIKEDYSFRKINGNKSLDLTDKQIQILKKIQMFTKALIKNANKFRKVVCSINNS